jgi:hypothetical protein
VAGSGDFLKPARAAAVFHQRAAPASGEFWLLPHSWDRWAAVFDEAGYAPVQPGWPDDPETVVEAKAHPEVFAHKSVGHAFANAVSEDEAKELHETFAVPVRSPTSCASRSRRMAEYRASVAAASSA